MGVRVKFDILPEIVRPKLDDLDVTVISFEDMFLPNIVPAGSGTQPPTGSSVSQSAVSKGYHWQSWSFNLSLSNIQSLNKFVKHLLGEVDRINKQVVQLLRIVRFFSSDLKSISQFLKFLLKQIVKQLKQLIDSLASSGIYVSFIWPSLDKGHPKYSIPILGGYQEFIKRVNFLCQNSPDPDAPRFKGAKDRVGGVIIGMIGGTEDPEFLANLYKNYKILSQFFGLPEVTPNPPKNFKVTAGMYKNPANENGYAPGVLLSWEASDGPVTDYVIYRTTDVKGVLLSVQVKDLNSRNQETHYKYISIHVPSLSDLATVKTKVGKKIYKYYDFFESWEVDKAYYYKIYSTIGDTFFEDNPLYRDIQSPIATCFLLATPKACVDPKEIDNYATVGINGELVHPFDLRADWNSFTIRTLLGGPIDDAFKKLDALADKLSGYVDTAGSAMSDYLKFMEKKIELLLDSVTAIEDTIDRINRMNLRGTFMVLTLDAAEGGMNGFVDRFNQACQTSNATTGLKTGKGSPLGTDSPVGLDAGGGIAKYTDRGIMLGIILLYGYPELKDERLLDFVPQQELATFKIQMNQTQKAIQIFLKMLGLDKGK